MKFAICVSCLFRLYSLFKRIVYINILLQCILAAIVLVNLKGVLMQITDIRALYKSRQYFDLVSLTSFLEN